MGGIYVHLPFCDSKCAYCAFYSIASAGDHIKSAVVDRIIAQGHEADGITGNSSWNTLYIGGGTPSTLPERMLVRLVEAMEKQFGPFQEITCEANPESATDRFLDEVRQAGVTRLSLGVQSLDAGCLARVSRRPVEPGRLCRIRERWQAQLSFDLICGLPGQTAAGLANDVASVVSMGIDHLSIYDLGVEDETPLADDVVSGRIELPEPDELWQSAVDAISATRFRRYEVANFALPGAECRHNIGYWSGAPYLGLGPSAASTLQIEQRHLRITQPSDIDLFMDASFFDAASVEELSRSTRILERIMLGLRLRSGISDEVFSAEFGVALSDIIPESLARFTEAGLLTDAARGRIAASGVGLDMLNVVLRDALAEAASRLES